MSLIYNSLYVFSIVLEIILFIYIFASWFPVGARFKEFLLVLLEPILEPIRYCMNNSIFRTRTIDLSPIIAFIILSYVQSFFYSLL